MTLDGQRDGNYNFSLHVGLGTQLADIGVSNVHSNSLGLSGQSFSEEMDFSEITSSYSNIPAVFAARVRSGSTPSGPCGNGCDVLGGAVLFNGNSGIADSALPVVTITAPVVTGQPALGTISAPVVPIPRTQP